MCETDVVALVTGVGSLVAAVAALIVAVRTYALQRQTKVLQVQGNETQARAAEQALRVERRDLAAELDRFAMWYSERIVGTGAPDPGPTSALLPAAVALKSYAKRLNQPGSEELIRWAMDLLNRLRNGESGMRPFEEAIVIASVASRWVRDGETSIGVAAAEVDPAYRP